MFGLVSCLNGMALHRDGRLLVAKSIGGLVYAVHPASGSVTAWMRDDRLREPGCDGMPGANGIKLHGGHAHVSVMGRDMVVRAPLDRDGAPGALEVVAERLRADDFAIAARAARRHSAFPGRA